MKLRSGCQTESLDNISEATSGHFSSAVSIRKFASGRSIKKVAVSSFHHSKSNIELFFNIISQWAIIIGKYAIGHSSNCVTGYRMLFSSKG